MPLLSIIIPTYNSEKWISDCIQSIADQDFSDFEIIIQDGKSADRTLEILEEYKAQFPSLSMHIVSKKDDGIYEAMNIAIGRSKGEWLYFLGSDDKLYSDDILANIFNSPAVVNEDVLYGNVHSTRFNGLYDGEFTAEKLLDQNICHQAIFLRRSVFESIGYFDVKYKAHADWDHNIRWFLSGKLRKKYLNLVIAEYADGGFSSENLDHEFLKEKNVKYLEYGRNVLKFRTKLRVIKKELMSALKNRDKNRIVKIVRMIPVMML